MLGGTSDAVPGPDGLRGNAISLPYRRRIHADVTRSADDEAAASEVRHTAGDRGPVRRRAERDPPGQGAEEDGPDPRRACRRSCAARRRSWRRCTARPPSCFRRRKKDFKRQDRRAARERRSSSTSGHRGVARAASSSRPLQRAATQFGRKVAFLGLNRPTPAATRAPSCAASRSPTRATRTRTTTSRYSLGPTQRMRRSPSSTTRPASASTPTPGVYATRALLVDDIRRYALDAVTRGPPGRGPDELAAALALRHAVFFDEQGVPVDEDIDGRDHEATHLVGGRRRRACSATCRLLVDGDRRAVQPARRGARRAPGAWIATALLARGRAMGPRAAARRCSSSPPRPTRSRSTSRPATPRAARCSWRPASSTSRWTSALV